MLYESHTSSPPCYLICTKLGHSDLNSPFTLSNSPLLSASSCGICFWLRQQHIRSSSQRPVPLHASAATPAAAAAAGAPTQQRPALQLFLWLWISPQHLSEQFPFLTHLCCPTTSKLLPGLQQHQWLSWCWPGLCSRSIRLLWSVTWLASCISVERFVLGACFLTLCCFLSYSIQLNQ